MLFERVDAVTDELFVVFATFIFVDLGRHCSTARSRLCHRLNRWWRRTILSDCAPAVHWSSYHSLTTVTISTFTTLQWGLCLHRWLPISFLFLILSRSFFPFGRSSSLSLSFFRSLSLSLSLSSLLLNHTRSYVKTKLGQSDVKSFRFVSLDFHLS